MWVASGVILVMVAAVMVVWLEVNSVLSVCVCLCVGQCIYSLVVQIKVDVVHLLYNHIYMVIIMAREGTFVSCIISWK